MIPALARLALVHLTVAAAPLVSVRPVWWETLVPIVSEITGHDLVLPHRPRPCCRGPPVEQPRSGQQRGARPPKPVQQLARPITTTLSLSAYQQVNPTSDPRLAGVSVDA